VRRRRRLRGREGAFRSRDSCRAASAPRCRSCHRAGTSSSAPSSSRLDETEQLRSRVSESGNAEDSTADTGEPAHDRFRRSAATILVSALATKRIWPRVVLAPTTPACYYPRCWSAKNAGTRLGCDAALLSRHRAGPAVRRRSAGSDQRQPWKCAAEASLVFRPHSVHQFHLGRIPATAAVHPDFWRFAGISCPLVSVRERSKHPRPSMVRKGSSVRVRQRAFRCARRSGATSPTSALSFRADARPPAPGLRGQTSTG
jgi:hypothetical protein